MSGQIKNVAIVGASGNIGKPVLDALLASQAFNITVISRKESSSTFPEGVTVKKLDYSDSDALLSAFKGQDAVVATVTATADGIDIETKVVEAAVQAGVKRFIPSDFGSDVTNDKLVETVPAFKGKRQVVDLLKSKESKDFSWTSIVNGPFFDWGLRVGFIGVDLKKKSVTLWDADAPAAYSTTNLAKVGASVVSVLQHLEETANRHVFPSSFTLTQQELHAALERVSGEKWSTVNASTQDLEKEGRDQLAKGDGTGMYKLIQVGVFRRGFGQDYGLRSKDNELLGLEEEDLDTVLREVLA